MASTRFALTFTKITFSRTSRVVFTFCYNISLIIFLIIDIKQCICGLTFLATVKDEKLIFTGTLVQFKAFAVVPLLATFASKPVLVRIFVVRIPTFTTHLLQLGLSDYTLRKKEKKKRRGVGEENEKEKVQYLRLAS